MPLIVYIPLIFLMTLSFVMMHCRALSQTHNYQMGINAGIQSSIPMGKFADQTKGIFTGFGGSFTVPTWRNSPVHVGFGYGWNKLGRNAQDIMVPDVKDGKTMASFAIQTVRHTYDVLLRLSPFRGRVQPFAEGIGGWSNFITRSDLKTHYSNGEKGDSRERLYNEASLNYGWGLGMQIRLLPHVFLEGKMQRIYATDTSVFNHESLVIAENGALEYETIEERPEFVTIQAGLTFKF